MRPLMGFKKLDHQRHTVIRERLQVPNIVQDIGYMIIKEIGKKHIERMQRN
jgi:hypothetical protein